MFHNVSVYPHTTDGTLIDPGSLGEALLFYQNVNIITNLQYIFSLIDKIGAGDFFTALDETQSKIICFHQFIGLVNNNNGCFFSDLMINVRDTTPSGIFEKIESSFYRMSGTSGKSRRLSRRLMDRCEFFDLSELLTGDRLFTDLLFQEINDSNMLNLLVQRFLSRVAPSYPFANGSRLKITPIERPFFKNFATDKAKLFQLTSDIDFRLLNTNIQAINPSFPKRMSPGFILTRVAESLMLALLCKKLESELIVEAPSASMVQERLETAWKRRLSSVDQISMFQEHVLRNGRSIREAINSGERRFIELLPVIHKTERFRKWVGELDDEKNLLAEYIDAMNKETWVNTLPAKTFRLFVPTTVSFVEPITGLALGLFDSLVLDKIVESRRPHIFVNGSMNSFLLREES